MNTIDQALLLIAARLRARCQEVYDLNEGYDGEPAAEQLANEVLASLSRPVAPAARLSAPTPISRGGSRGRSKSCKYCNADGMSWDQSDGRWTLLNPDGSRHLCRREARQAAQPQPEQTFADSLKKV